MKKRRGFTLVELMIGMAVIAILATAAISAYTGYVKKGRDAARAEMAQNLNTAVMSYAASNDGNPPADAAAFDDFLASAGQIFGSTANVSNGTLVEDPVGGKEVCLDAEGNPNQPCAFHYTAYADGTYSISYGVEHETSTEENFYKTTNSIPDPDIPTTSIAKYGVYTGTAKYIGQPSTTIETEEVDGVDVSYTPPGAASPVPLVVVYQSARIDAVIGGTISGGGDDCGITTCNAGQGCVGNTCVNACGSPGTFCTVGQICDNNTCQNLCGIVVCAEGMDCVNDVCVSPDPCAQPSAAGTVCADGTVYVSSVLRTTTNVSASTYSWSSAITYCDNLSSNGHTDWSLPTITQLNEMYTKRVSIGGFNNLIYWSSSTLHGVGWWRNFFDGTQGGGGANNRLRCVRAP